MQLHIVTIFSGRSLKNQRVKLWSIKDATGFVAKYLVVQVF